MVRIKAKIKNISEENKEITPNYGILFGGYLLSEDNFIEIFQDFYAQKGEELKTRLKEDILKKASQFNTRKRGGGVTKTFAIDLKKNKASEIYADWLKIFTELFGNDEVTIIAGVKFGSTEFKWTNNLNERRFVNERGIGVTKANLKNIANNFEKEGSEIDALFAAEELNKIINDHYSDMIKTLDTFSLSSEDAQLLHILLSYRQSKLRAKDKEHYTGKTYDEIIFASQQNAEGKKLDAFMNHIGQFHVQLFYLLSKGTISSDEITPEAQADVKSGEFLEYFQNSPIPAQKWLLDSLNSTSWLSGGDIVVTDKNGKVVFNIQLKTTGTKYGKTFSLATSRLATFAKEMVDLMDNVDVDSVELAKNLFEMLKIEAASNIDPQEIRLTDAIYKEIYNRLNIVQK